MATGDERGRPTAVFFDLDGTLLDSLPGILYSASAAFAQCGMKMADSDLRSLIGPPIRTILARMAKVDTETVVMPEDLDLLESAFRASYDSEGWSMTPHYEEAANVLRRLRASGKRLFVVSNKPRHISVRILEAEATLGLFQEVVTRDSMDPPYEDKRTMMRYLLQKWHLQPESCWMVGDTIEDAQAASDVGMRFCLMSHGYGDVPAGSPIPVALRLTNFSELMPNLAQE